MPTNKHNFILGTLLGAMVVVVVTIIFMNNGLRYEIEKIKSGKVYVQSITPDKLSEDLFTTVELQLDSGETVEAKLLEGTLDSGYLTGDLTLETNEGDQLVAKVVNTYEIKDGSITEEKLSKAVLDKLNKEIDTSIKNRSIAHIKLKENTITSAELADGSVTETKILDGSITGGKLQNAIIETRHLNNYAVTEININDNAISTRVIATGAITSGKILDQTITNEDISSAASIAWSKLDKTGSSLTDLTTRNFQDLTNRTANYLTITDAGGYYTATDVEGALQELALTDGTFVSKTGDTMTGALNITVPTATTSGLVLQTTDNDTTNPLFQALAGDGSGLITITADGKVGIGTESPSAAFEVTGNVFLKPTSSFGGIRMGDTSLTDNINDPTVFIARSQGKSALTLRGGGSSGVLNILDNSGVNLLRVTSTGNVGIGTTTPSAKLDIQGTAGFHLRVGKIGEAGDILFARSVDGSYLSKIGYDSTNDGKFEFKTTGGGGSFRWYQNISGFVKETMALAGSNGYLGLNESSPSARLHINTGTATTIGQIIQANSATQSANLLEINSSAGGGGDLFVVDADGKVGIGTNSPGALLEVSGSVGNLFRVKSTSSSVNPQIAFINDAGESATFIYDRSALAGDFAIRQNNASGAIDFEIGGNAQKLRLESTKVIVNGLGENVDFIVEGDTVPYLLSTNAGTDRVGIGTGSPSQKLEVKDGFIKINTADNVGPRIFFQEQDGGAYWGIGANVVTGSQDEFVIYDYNASSARLFINSLGNVGIGTTTPQSAFHVPDGRYAQLEDNNAGAPPATDCDADTERGRISIDTTNNRLYICNGATRGWDYITLND